MTTPVLSTVSETVNMGVLNIHLSSTRELQISTSEYLRTIYVTKKFFLL